MTCSHCPAFSLCPSILSRTQGFGFSFSLEVFGQMSRCIKVLPCTFFSNCSKSCDHQAEIQSVNSAACGQLFLPTMHYEGLIVKVVHLLAPLVAGANRRKKKKESNLLMIESQIVMKTIGASEGSAAGGRGAGALCPEQACRHFYKAALQPLSISYCFLCTPCPFANVLPAQQAQHFLL